MDNSQMDGPALRSRRIARGWSQAKVAEMLGTTQQTVDRIERGVTTHSRVLDPMRNLLVGLPPVSPQSAETQTAFNLINLGDGRAYLHFEDVVPYEVAREVVLKLLELPAVRGVANDMGAPEIEASLILDPDWLKSELEKPGRSQSDLARHLGLDSSAVNRLVNGSRELKAREAEQVKAYLAETATDESEQASSLMERIEERLKATGLTANAASERAGCGRDFVRDIQRGRIKEPSAAKLKALADALECTPGYLMGWEAE